MTSTAHNTLTAANLHVPGYRQDADPGAVGAGKYWIDSSGGAGQWVLKIRNAADTGWETVSTSSAGQVVGLSFVIGDGSTPIGTGIKGDVVVEFAGTITAVTLLADQSGSIVVDVWKDTYANFPPTVADSITAAAKPTISAATKSQDTTLTGWTTAIAAGSILRFNVDSAATVTRVTLALKIARS